ncbi:hypothetical protein [uncultured Hyphomicrobium sp.]|uniref:hypothetical protein n=1 Tax=uncultured Hyphomicrobium sp. TaxID=194373 RepID=UPI0025E7693D|nr:hypothetical protein [uncultured Hyphomicrobium sp.]
MIDPTTEAVAEFEHRLPAAYSQGFAHIRVLSVINPDDPGPLGGPDAAFPAEATRDYMARAPLDDLLRAD